MNFEKENYSNLYSPHTNYNRSNYGNYTKKVWFEGTKNLPIELSKVENELNDFAHYFEKVVSKMPGLTTVELLEHDSSSYKIKTNEGIMNRTNLSISKRDGSISVEFDEEYDAGKKITFSSHFLHEFTTSENGVTHKLQISNLNAPGFIGFFYRNFGSKNIGNSVLNSHETCLLQ